MVTELVPVKTKFPPRPPKGEPLWLHLDWIRTTAAPLAEQWAQLAERRMHWGALRRAGVNDPDLQHQMKKWQNLCDEVQPLYEEIKTYLPLEVYGEWKHIENLHKAEKAPKKAQEEWERARKYVSDQLAKSEVRLNDNTIAKLISEAETIAARLSASGITKSLKTAASFACTSARELNQQYYEEVPIPQNVRPQYSGGAMIRQQLRANISHEDQQKHDTLVQAMGALAVIAGVNQRGNDVANRLANAIAALKLLPAANGSVPTPAQLSSDNLFNSGHSESDGEWSDILTLTAIGKAAICDSRQRTIINLFKKTGLIQKSRQKWRVKLDQLEISTADRLLSAAKKK